MKRLVFTASALLFAFTAAQAADADKPQSFVAENGRTLSGNFPKAGITIQAGATVTFAGVYAAYASDGKLGAVECLGDATIILAPNTRNVVSNYMTCASAVFVPAGHTLTIKGEGTLEAVSVNDYCSGIGACSKWLGMDGKKGDCGNIVIAGGKVTAIAGGACAAAIGAAQYKGKCGNITICGNADVTAESTFGAAAIGAAGCGGPCGDITIKDNASVKAVAGGKKGDYGANGAGIGAGNDSPCGNIVIATTGRVEATGAPGTWGGAGIGGGGFSSDIHDTAICGNITISSGTIIAKGNGDCVDRDHGNGIGCTQVSACGVIRITGGNITALGGPNAAGIGANGTNSAIIIEGGTIKAVAGELTGVRSAAAIGPSGTDSHCGDITITGGSCDLEGGPDCPGIGIARRGSSCGRITIGEGVKLLKIKRGECATDYIAAVTKDREQGIVTIAPSLSQTYSDDKSTLIIGHDATTSSASSPASASENLLCHITFDDQANPLKATVGANAIVRTGRDTVVSGLGNTKWESPSGDGALRVPSGTHIAVPVPPSLAKQPGLPYSVEMKVRFPEPRSKWCCLMNMPAENYSDALAFLTTDADKRVVLKASGRIEGAGTFRLGEWNTFHFQFGEKTTRVFVDGREVFKQDFTLAGSRADCSKAGGYFLFAADDNGEDDQMSIADLKIYAGIAEPSDEFGIGKKDVPPNTTSPSSVATPTANTPASPAGGNNGQAGGATSTNGGGKMSDEVKQTLDTFTLDDGLSATEKIPALKAYIETHLDEPGIEKLIDLLEKLAKDANDAETLKWVEEIRKKLADRKSGAPANNDTTCRYPGPQPGELKMAEPLKLPEDKRAPDYLNPDGTPVGSEKKPSAEVQQTLDTFSADDGLSAAEKIPALKAYIETHLDEPGIEKLIDLLEKLAKDANDAETLKWVEEIRKKLADRKSGGGKDGKTGLDVLTDTENVDPGKKNVDEKKDKTDGEEIDDEGATKDEIVAAAEAAMKDLSVFAPSDEKIAAIDAAFKKMPKIRRTKPESSRKPIEPVMSDAFFDSLPPRQLIAHFRELMRDILGPMTPDTEKRFEKEFAAAISYPTDEVVEWVRKAAPIISEIQRLKAGMMQEFVDFDSTFGDACIAQNFDYYDGAYNRISDASRTVCSMEAIKARMEELFKMYLALGPMPNAAEQQKQDAAEYKAAGKAVKDYIIIGGEVTDAIKDIEGVYHVDPCAFTLTVSNDSKEPENSGRLTDSPADNHTHAPWRMEKLYIKPITQFGGEDGLVYVYIYGEDPPDGDGEAKYDSRVLEAWAVPDGEGGLLFFGGGDNLIAMKKELRDAFLSNKDEKGNDITDMDVRKEYLHPECIHLKPAKDDDGRDILILKHHWLHDDGNWKPVSPGSSEYHKVYRDKTYTYATMVFRPSPAEDYQTLPEAHEDCTAAWTKGNTVEEKALEAARLYPEALKRFEKEREQYTKKAASFGDTYATLPTIYELYFVISGAPEISLGYDYDKTNPLDGKAPVAIYGDKITGTDDVYLNMAKQRPEVQPPPDYKDRWGVWANMACEEYLGRLDLFGFSHSKKWDISICGGQSWSNDTPPEKKAKVDSASVDLKANWTCPFPTVVRVVDGAGPLAFDISVDCKRSQHDSNIPENADLYRVRYMWNVRDNSSEADTNYVEIASSSGGSGKRSASFVKEGEFYYNLNLGGTNYLHFSLYGAKKDAHKELYYSDNREIYSSKCPYKLVYMNAEQAEELAAKLGESLSEILTPPEEDSDIREELMQKVKDAKEAQEAKEANIEFHKANIEFLDKRMASLKEEISKEKDPARKDALQFQIICAESDKLYEQDRIRAEQTGVWRPTRTPFDEMCITQVRESAMREIAEINAANRARKRAEAIADKLPTKEQQDKAYEMIDKIVSKDGNDYESLVKLGDIMRDQYQNYLDYDRHMAAAEDAYWSKKLQYAENTKLACDIALSLCGGASGYAKAIEASYVCITSYKEGGFTNAFKKTVCTIWDCVDVASEVIDGIVEDGWKGALKKGEISFAMHYGIPYLLGKMKGPPDGTGCYNSFDVDRLNKWHPAPRLATRKPPRVADVNAAFFEKNYATQKISQYIEKKNAFNAIKDFTKNDPDKILAARRAMFKAAGEVNSNPMAKAILKYDPQYKRLGISKSFALDIDDINDIATTRTLNTMVEKGYSRQELVSFRNKSSIGSVGMDADFGLKEYKDMQITLNNKPITKHQWAEATQKQLNSDYFDLTGQSAEKSFVNVTYSGDKEAYKNLAVLKASKDPKAMRHIIQSSSLSDVQQMMDVTKYKANVMLDIKGHPKLVGKYEAIRGTGKDLETKIVPAIKGEIDALKEEAKKLAKVGKALPKAQEVKLEKLQAAHSRYKKVELACKRVGELKVPLYEADDYVRTATGGKSIPELLDDIDTMLQSLNLLRPKK